MLARMQQQGMQMVGKADQTVDPTYDALHRQYQKLLDDSAKLEKAVRFHQSAVFANISCLGQIRMEFERNLPVEHRQSTELFDQTATAYADQVKPKFEEVYEARVFGPLEQYKQELGATTARCKERAAKQRGTRGGGDPAVWEARG